MLSAVPARGLTLMPMGDSITKGFHGTEENRGSYRQELAQLLPNIDMVGDANFFLDEPFDADFQGISGFSIEDMINVYGDAVARHKPDIVLLLAGTNNHWNDPATTDFDAKYQALINMIRAGSPQARIVMATVPKFGYDKQAPDPNWTQAFVDQRNLVHFPAMNEAIRRVAAQNAGVSVVDFYSALNPAIDLNTDAVHPIASGQNKLADLFYDAVLGLLSDFDTDGDVDDADFGFAFSQFTGPNNVVPKPGGSDLDGDLDVDDADFGQAFALFTGPGVVVKQPVDGDLDLDFDVDDADFGVAFAAFTGPGNPAPINTPSDLDADGDVDDADYGLLFAQFTGPVFVPDTPPPGDRDDDGDIDDADFGIMFAAFSGPNVVPALAETGDFDGDGDIDDADFGLLFSQFTGPASAVIVPEPASLAMLSCTACLLLRRRKRA